MKTASGNRRFFCYGLTGFSKLSIFDLMSPRKVALRILLLLTMLSIGYPTNANVENLLTDIKVVYLYDQKDDIDWPLIYYLGIENGCHIDLATIKAGPVYKHLPSISKTYNLTSSRFYVPDTTRSFLDSTVRDLYGEYFPDIVILPESSDRPEMLAFEDYLMNIEYDTASVFNIKKYFRRAEKGGTRSLYLNARQYYNNHYDEIAGMAQAISEKLPTINPTEVYSIYNLARSNITPHQDSPSFLSGIERFKFNRIMEKYIESDIKRTALRLNRNKYLRHLNNAMQQSGLARIESLIAAMDELMKIKQTYHYQIGAVDSDSPVTKYIERAIGSLSSAIFHEAEIDYDGRIVIRETAGGRKLKFISEINNNGLLRVKAGRLEFIPYWSDTSILIDSNWVEILPNNAMIREYTIDVDPKRLETIVTESLEFKGQVQYLGNSVDFRYGASSYEKSAFSVEFVPDFLIIKPFSKLQVDRLVEPASLKAILRKPVDFTGKVQIDVVAPPSILAGAYKKEIELATGVRAVELKIPLVATRSMGSGKHEVVINIVDNGKILASDIACIRQAEHNIPARTKIALLQDVNGLLEDILIETGANYKILSDRFLKVGEFGLYDVLLLGTGCFTNYESLEVVYDKIKKYMESGGHVIVFGQTDDWPDDLLPVSIVSASRRVSEEELGVRDRDHPIFKRKYKIEMAGLLKKICAGRVSYPAIVFPGEKIIEAANSTALLSVTKLGKGWLVYCGLPLLEMIRDLDVEAIELFSNLINYTGK